MVEPFNFPGHGTGADRESIRKHEPGWQRGQRNGPQGTPDWSGSLCKPSELNTHR